MVVLQNNFEGGDGTTTVATSGAFLYDAAWAAFPHLRVRRGGVPFQDGSRRHPWIQSTEKWDAMVEESYDRMLATHQMPEVEVVSPTGGVRKEKPYRWDLISQRTLRLLAQLLGEGAKKYEDRNWERGYKWSSSYNSAMNHMSAFWSGEDIDPEMGIPHTVCAIFHMMALTEFGETHPEFDDRPGVDYFTNPDVEPLARWELELLDDESIEKIAVAAGFRHADMVSANALISWLDPAYPPEAAYKTRIQAVARQRATIAGLTPESVVIVDDPINCESERVAHRDAERQMAEEIDRLQKRVNNLLSAGRRSEEAVTRAVDELEDTQKRLRATDAEYAKAARARDEALGLVVQRANERDTADAALKVAVEENFDLRDTISAMEREAAEMNGHYLDAKADQKRAEDLAAQRLLQLNEQISTTNRALATAQAASEAARIANADRARAAEANASIVAGLREDLRKEIEWRELLPASTKDQFDRGYEAGFEAGENRRNC